MGVVIHDIYTAYILPNGMDHTCLDNISTYHDLVRLACFRLARVARCSLVGVATYEQLILKLSSSNGVSFNTNTMYIKMFAR